MKTRLFTIGILIAGLLPILSSCSNNEEAQVVEEKSISVRTAIIETGNDQLTKTYTGSLEGEKQSTIFARIAEVVTGVHVREGDRVKADQVMISLDQTGASSRYLETEAIYRNAEKTFKKMDYLFKEGAVSESQYDEAQTSYDVARASFDAAARRVEIESPIEGEVTSLDVAAGDLPMVGQRLATVATVEKLRIRFDVNQAEIGRFAVGGEVVVSMSNSDSRTVGKIAAISRSADPVTRSFEVEVLIDNQNGNLQIGTFANVEMVLERFEDVLTVPRSSIVNLNDLNVVYKVVNGRAVKQVVTLGAELGKRVLISGGLTVGDTLVTLGQSYLDDGTKVNISVADRDD